MPMYMLEATYTTEGLRGLIKDKASGRKAAVASALASAGCKLVDLYYALGKADVYVICECPDNLSAAAISLAVTASGAVRTRTIPLLTVDEADKALAKQVGYRAPGA